MMIIPRSASAVAVFSVGLLFLTSSVRGDIVSSEAETKALAAHGQEQVALYGTLEPRASGHLAIREPALDQTLSTIAFGSCVRENRPQPIWKSVLSSKPDVFLFLGDNAYLDTTQAVVMHRKYSEAALHPGFEELAQTTPILATWDDHDFGVNDGGRHFTHKELARVAYLDFYQVPENDPRRDEGRSNPQDGGIYFSNIYGPPGQRVQIIMLDTRWNRDDIPTSRSLHPETGRRITEYLPNESPEATLLGATQWAWLREQLLKPAEVRLIGSSIQVLPEQHIFEKWANFPHERQRLFDLIRETSAAGVIFLSGDRHFAELSAQSAGVGYPLFDFTSSGLNMAARFFRHAEPNRHRISAMPSGNHFGLVRIDWNGVNTQIRFDCIDEAGDVAFGMTIPLALLQFGSEQRMRR